MFPYPILYPVHVESTGVSAPLPPIVGIYIGILLITSLLSGFGMIMGVRDYCGGWWDRHGLKFSIPFLVVLAIGILAISIGLITGRIR